jgi:hypothetical protein
MSVLLEGKVIMPNHVTTFINAAPAVLQGLMGDGNDDCPIDFNVLIPMPKNVFRGGLGDDEKERYPGDLNWYDWSVNHWGTKWNAYDYVALRDDAISFQTAWSFPMPVITELSRRFPDEPITVAFADEDLGYNVGFFQFRNGEVAADSGINEAPYGARLQFATSLLYGEPFRSVMEEENADGIAKIQSEITAFVKDNPDSNQDKDISAHE